jgi:DNA-directed RNA polymerase specialized sigma24 family protein
MSPFYTFPAESELVELADRIAQGDTVAENRLVWLYSERVGAFIHGTAVNLINNFQRSRRRRPIMGQLPNDLPGLDGAEILESKSDFDHVWRGVEHLGAGDREVLQFLYVEGMNLKEIAIRLGLKPDVVRQRKYRALKHLMAQYSESHDQGTPDRHEDRAA